MKIVMLSDLSDFGLGMLKAFTALGIKVDTIVTAQRQPALTRLRRMLSAAGFRATARETLKRVGARLSRRNDARVDPLDYATRVIQVSGFNAPDCIQLLNSIQPDLIVLGGAPILKEPVLATARLGVLNAHPGMLPKYRGVDVVAWAILNGDPVGVTVHRVDKGIDTGARIRSVEVELRAGDDLDAIRERATRIAGELMAAVVAEAIERAAIPDDLRDLTGERHPLCRRMPGPLLKQVEEMLRLRTRSGERVNE